MAAKQTWFVGFDAVKLPPEKLVELTDKAAQMEVEISKAEDAFEAEIDPKRQALDIVEEVLRRHACAVGETVKSGSVTIRVNEPKDKVGWDTKALEKAIKEIATVAPKIAAALMACKTTTPATKSTSVIYGGGAEVDGG